MAGGGRSRLATPSVFRLSATSLLGSALLLEVEVTAFEVDFPMITLPGIARGCVDCFPEPLIGDDNGMLRSGKFSVAMFSFSFPFETFVPAIKGSDDGFRLWAADVVTVRLGLEGERCFDDRLGATTGLLGLRVSSFSLSGGWSRGRMIATFGAKGVDFVTFPAGKGREGPIPGSSSSTCHSSS